MQTLSIFVILCCVKQNTIIHLEFLPLILCVFFYSHVPIEIIDYSGIILFIGINYQLYSAPN